MIGDVLALTDKLESAQKQAIESEKGAKIQAKKFQEMKQQNDRNETALTHLNDTIANAQAQLQTLTNQIPEYRKTIATLVMHNTTHHELTKTIAIISPWLLLITITTTISIGMVNSRTTDINLTHHHQHHIITITVTLPLSALAPLTGYMHLETNHQRCWPCTSGTRQQKTGIASRGNQRALAKGNNKRCNPCCTGHCCWKETHPPTTTGQ